MMSAIKRFIHNKPRRSGFLILHFFYMYYLLSIFFVSQAHFVTIILPISYSSPKHIRTKVIPDLHLYLTYSKNGGNLGLVLNDKK